MSALVLQYNIAVGSTNPVKIESSSVGITAALKIESKDINFEGFDVPSGVPAQPVGDDETKQGSINRAITAYECFSSKYGNPPQFSIGLEGGISALGEENMECFAWISIFNGIKTSCARTGSFVLPPAIRDHVRGGMELGDADDAVFGTKNAKQGDGTVGHLTRNVINRTSYYSPAVTLAMIPFLWPELYP